MNDILPKFKYDPNKIGKEWDNTNIDSLYHKVFEFSMISFTDEEQNLIACAVKN